MTTGMPTTVINRNHQRKGPDNWYNLDGTDSRFYDTIPLWNSRKLEYIEIGVTMTAHILEGN